MKRFNADICPANPALEQAPKVFKPVGVDVAANIFPRMVNGLMNVILIQSVDHAREYVRGNVHTNGLENFWSLLKRGIRGTYISVEPFHLFRYLDEQAFRFNERENTDSGRFLKGIIGIIGKRLQYAKLIGAQGSNGFTTPESWQAA